MALPFTIDQSLAPSDPVMQKIYSPLFAVLGGQQQARIEQAQQQSLRDAELENLKKRLETERYGQMTPLELQKTGLEAAQAQVLNNPDALSAYAAGKIGTARQQQVQGAEAVRKAKLFENFNKLRETALNPEIPQDMRAIAENDAKAMARMIASTDPENIAKLQQVEAKVANTANKPISYSDVNKAMTYAAQVGIPVADALDLLQQGKLHMLGMQQQEQQPTQQTSDQTGIYKLGVSSLTPEQQNAVAKRLETNLKIIENPNMPETTKAAARKDLQDLQTQYPSTGNTGNLLEQKFLRQSSNATVQERSANLANNFLQTANDVRNFLESPELSTMGIFSGLAGKDKDSILSSLSAFVGRKLTSEEDRALQQAMSGFKVTMANVIGGGFATASSKARMDALADQIPREGDSPSAKITWLARVKQELEAAAETFETRQGATDQQKQLVKKAMVDIEKSIPWNMSDVNAALRQKTGQKATSESSAIPNRSTTPLTAEQFNTQWANLPTGQSLVGPDGKVYTKKKGN